MHLRVICHQTVCQICVATNFPRSVAVCKWATRRGKFATQRGNWALRFATRRSKFAMLYGKSALRSATLRGKFATALEQSCTLFHDKAASKPSLYHVAGDGSGPPIPAPPMPPGIPPPALDVKSTDRGV